MEAAAPHPNAELLNRFYRAFAALDADTMAACYAPDARFQDEVFTLTGRDEIAAMWRMLCQAPGWLLGWSPMLRHQVQTRAAAKLKAFRSRAG